MGLVFRFGEMEEKITQREAQHGISFQIWGGIKKKITPVSSWLVRQLVSHTSKPIQYLQRLDRHKLKL